MKALVTGASGFIGSTLIGDLDTLGFEVCTLLRATPRQRDSVALKYHRAEGDSTDFDFMCRALKNVDYVFHLGGMSSARSRKKFFDSNFQSTEGLARAVALVQPRLTRFVYLSSLAAAGPSHSLEPRIETEKEQPVSFYGESKLQAEKALLKYKTVFPISIIRPPLIYGPNDQTTSWMIQTVTHNLMPIFRGSTESGHKYYSAIHVKDLCRGLVQAALSSSEKVFSGEVFFLSGDGVHTYRELMMTIAEKMNCEPMQIGVPKFAIKLAALGLSAVEALTRTSFPLTLDHLKAVLPDYWICSNLKAKRLLGFAPEIDLATGIAQVIEGYKRQKWI